MKLTNNKIGDQYRSYPYPKPVDDLEEHYKTHGYVNDPLALQNLIWPRTGYPEGRFSILCAGCGVNEAATIAFLNKRADVTGVDVSDTSLAHARYLKEKHGLDNLELRKMDLHDVGDLGREFDLIISSGVLHHLPEPATGFLALREVLKSDGSFVCMLYARYGRIGVYMIQELARMLGLEQNDEGVGAVREILESAGEGHQIDYLRRTTRDFGFDSGLVDLFLNPQDTAFSVLDVLDMAEKTGFVFLNWLDNFDYHPQGAIPAHSGLMERMLRLPLHRQWAAMELLGGRIHKHAFILTHPDRDPAEYRVDLDLESMGDCIPVWAPRIMLRKALDQEPAGYVELQRDGRIFSIREVGVSALKHMDGQRTVKDCLDLARKDPVDQAPGISLFYSMWKMGHVQLRIR